MPRPTVRFEDGKQRLYKNLKDKIAQDDNISSFQDFVLGCSKKYLAGEIEFTPDDYLSIVINVFDLDIYEELSDDAQSVFDVITHDLDLESWQNRKETTFSQLQEKTEYDREKLESALGEMESKKLIAFQTS